MQFTQQLQLHIAQAITRVEQHTDAEIFCVLTPRSDDYDYIPILWAALIALASPLLLMLTPWWGSSNTALLVQLVVFVVSGLICRWQPIFNLIIPKKVRYWRAASMARRQFLEQGLHRTQTGTGVLIFVSAQERYVEILTDQGISQHVNDEQWLDIVSAFVERVKQDQIAEGFMHCIESCGHLLAKHYPASCEKNELPNRLVVLPD
ncbi:MAG: TPM domain-containing protein [Gammaproteobacteria bacterium]